MAKVYMKEVTAQIGEVYSVSPEFAKTGITGGSTMRGKVVCIPAHRRYAVLEFSGVHGTSRECFWAEELVAKCRA